MKKKRWLILTIALTGLILGWGSGVSSAQMRKVKAPDDRGISHKDKIERIKFQRELPAMRRAAGARFKQLRARVLGQALAKAKREATPAGIPELGPLGAPYIFWPFVAPESGPFVDSFFPGVDPAAQILAPPIPDPLGIPHYFGPYPNYANSPLPKGAIAAINLVGGGSGYVNPAVLIEDAYNTGSGAAATPVFDPASGTITGITINNAGSNYSAPVVYIVDTTGPGTGADALAVLGPPWSGGLRKFVDRLAGLDPAAPNEIGQYIPVAVPDTTTFPGSHYYEIEVGLYDEQLHSDLGTTRLTGYRQTNTSDPNVSQFHYLGPLIIAQKNTPVRIKFTNSMPTGAGGDLFIPVDTTLMGAGATPNGIENYTQNRAELHLHGGDNPWISDGTPYQWTTPAGETTSYPKGVSVYNVPDMPDPGRTAQQGVLTYYYPNQLSARLLFYHDHAVGITRLNVYAGQAAGYLVTDPVEGDLMNGTNATGVNPNLSKLLPGVGTPLVIQDKSFVDPATIYSQDPTWGWGATPGTPLLGDLWMPHVYMPNQNPGDMGGMNAFGRWHYGPWFWPPTNNIAFGPVNNPYYDPINAPWETQMMPGTPNPSMAMEAFMDTPIINGTVYPYLEVEPKLYRFRVLSVCNDRFMNLQLYKADPAAPSIDGRTLTEVKMVPAVATPGFPPDWPKDGREGGVPDPATMGPDWVVIGTEGGFLPAPAVIPQQPVDWNLNPTTFNMGNVSKYSLLLGPAERADVLVDFSAFAGQTLILYNDAPAAFPARDPRYDYYTGSPDQLASGGTPPTQPGFGPNVRTIMQIRVGTTISGPVVPLNLAELNFVFQKTGTKRGVFEASQPPVIVPEARYNSAYNGNFPADPYVRIYEASKTFQTVGGTTLTLPFQPKALQDEMGEAYDVEYGRMSGMLGVQLPATTGMQRFTLFPYGSPPLEIIETSMTPMSPVAGDSTQIWKITHNGVDTHTIHFHMYNVQIINRVAWDNGIGVPDDFELGWKETIRVNPLEDTIVALRPVLPDLPWELPNSVRPIDLSKPLGAVLQGPPFGFKDPLGNPVSVINHDVNWGWEYVLHCHLLGHEEMDMMHGQIIAVPPRAPSGLTGVRAPSGTSVDLTWIDNSIAETGYTIQRAGNPNFAAILSEVSFGADITNYTDSGLDPNATYFWRVIGTNQVGDNETPGFPVVSVKSAPSNIMGMGPGGLITLQLSSPNGGESWVAGSTHNVTWTQSGLAGQANIDLYKGGAFIKTLGTADVTSGTFSWTIGPTEPAAADYRIQVAQGGMADESNLNFALIAAAVKSDFNNDGIADILWRNYGTGADQGFNLLWLITQTAAPIPAPLGQAAAESAPTKTTSIQSSILNPAGAQRAEISLPKNSFKTMLTGDAKLARKPKLVSKDPLGASGAMLREGGRGAGLRRLKGIPTRKDAAAVTALKPGQVEISAIGLNREIMLNPVVDTAWEIVGTGDFDGDRDPDILWRNYGTGPYQGLNVIWYMNGSTFVGEVVFSQVIDTNWKIVGTGDFDGDLDPDILWRFYGTGPLQGLNIIWYMNGSAFQSEVVYSQVTDTDWRIVATGDFDGDTDPDIIWRNVGTGVYQGLNVVWYMNGQSFTSEAIFSQVLDTNWQIAGAGDFDGDSDPDLLWRFYGTGPLQGLNIIWYMNGATFVSEEVYGAVTDTTWRIVNY